MRFRNVALPWWSLALLGAGCTLVADFEDPADDGESLPDGATVTPAGDASSIIVDGSVSNTDGQAATDSNVSTTDSPATQDVVPLGPCDGKPNGHVVQGEERCCGQTPTNLTTDTNCGACGISCRTDLGHHCQYVFGKFWACTGCATDAGGGGGGCFTSCCSTATALGYCSPETVCGLAVPICNDSPCEQKSPGSSCQDSFPFEPPHCGY